MDGQEKWRGESGFAVINNIQPGEHTFVLKTFSEETEVRCSPPIKFYIPEGTKTPIDDVQFSIIFELTFFHRLSEEPFH
jgi:hypothetical protein